MLWASSVMATKFLRSKTLHATFVSTICHDSTSRGVP